MYSSPRQSQLEKLYTEYLSSEKSADFVQSVARYYTIQTLQKLAEEGNRVARRAAVLAIGFLGDVHCNGTLGQALHDSDRAVRLLADHGIRQLWFRSPQPYIASNLRRLARLNQRSSSDEAIRLASRLIIQAPDVAEAWNQRAIALFAQGDYWHAVCDCRETLDLNPYHFVSAIGLAHSYLHLGDRPSALQAFRAALSANPDLERIRLEISQLEDSLEGR